MKLYRKFVEAAMGSESQNPLEEVFASTFLGSQDFIRQAKERWIGFKNVDSRDIPVLKELVERPSLEGIEQKIDSVIGEKHSFYKKFCLYASHQIGGYSLKQIGAYYAMRGSAVSQSNRRFKQDIANDKKLRKILIDIKRGIRSGDC